MDKVFSARIDESTVGRIDLLARELHTTKKHVIEQAITEYFDRVREERGVDMFDDTFGAWKRKESAEATVRRSRKAFRESMTRHHE